SEQIGAGQFIDVRRLAASPATCSGWLPQLRYWRSDTERKICPNLGGSVDDLINSAQDCSTAIVQEINKLIPRIANGETLTPENSECSLERIERDCSVDDSARSVASKRVNKVCGFRKPDGFLTHAYWFGH